jgi:hypothetical protein
MKERGLVASLGAGRLHSSHRSHASVSGLRPAQDRSLCQVGSLSLRLIGSNVIKKTML